MSLDPRQRTQLSREAQQLSDTRDPRPAHEVAQSVNRARAKYERVLRTGQWF